MASVSIHRKVRKSKTKSSRASRLTQERSWNLRDNATSTTTFPVPAYQPMARETRMMAQERVEEEIPRRELYREDMLMMEENVAYDPVSQEEFMQVHTLPAFDFSTLFVPHNTASERTERKILVEAAMYRDILFRSQPARPFLGGWWLLATKNWKANGGRDMVSMEDLGFEEIRPRGFGDRKYNKTLLRHVRDGSITIKSCTGHTGSYFVTMSLKNEKNEPQTAFIPYGQTFEQNDFRAVQNLAVTGFYEPQSEVKAPEDVLISWKEVTPDGLQITIPAKGSRDVDLECFCIDQNFSCPAGEEMNLTPCKVRDMSLHKTQREIWDHFNRLGNGDLKEALKAETEPVNSHERDCPFELWNVERMAMWVSNLVDGDVAKTYKEICVANGLNGQMMRDVAFGDLTELGFNRIHARLVVRKINELRQGRTADVPANECVM